MKSSTKRFIAGVVIGVFLSSCFMYHEVHDPAGRLALAVTITVCSIYIGLIVTFNCMEGGDGDGEE